jgi:hypothetical protein
VRLVALLQTISHKVDRYVLLRNGLDTFDSQTDHAGTVVLVRIALSFFDA